MSVTIHRSSQTPRSGRSRRQLGWLAVPAVAVVILATVAVPGAALGQGPQTNATARGTTGVPAAERTNSWVPTGAMSVARSGATATLLPGGDVLVAGGGTSSAELYDASTGTFTPTGSMSTARTDATATLLQDGDVLVAGGCCHGNAQLKTAELYDPGTGTWTPTGSMNIARSSDTATLLPDGEVLVAGGGCNGHAFGCDAGSYLGTLRSAELYDPQTGTWRRTGNMSRGREYFTASLLQNGQVLVAGGFNDCDDTFCVDLRSAELYDPATGEFTKTGPMQRVREQQTATVLRDGQVLVAGGLHAPGGGGRSFPIAQAELYDPATGTWSPTATMANPHHGGTATLLRNGWVLVAGGHNKTSEIYQPILRQWVNLGVMSTVRTDQTATLLANGHVLVTGGRGPDGHAQATAEVFLAGRGPIVALRPTALLFSSQQVGSTSGQQSFRVVNVGTAELTLRGIQVSGLNPGDFMATTDCTDQPLQPHTQCLVKVTFSPSATGVRRAEVGLIDDAPGSPQNEVVTGYGDGPNVWVPTGSITGPRDSATATLLRNGQVLVAGGEDEESNDLASAQLYNPATGTFSATGSLNVARAYGTAVRLRDGDVLVAGGLGGQFGSQLSSAEIYHPASGQWTSTTDMHQVGYTPTSTLLPSGKVLVTGLGNPDTAEVYDPASATWTDTGPMTGNGYFGTATLLPDGQVLVAGGGGTSDAELYHPSTNSWSATESMNAARTRATATLLPDGQVLVAGGDDANGNPVASSELYNSKTATWTLTTGSMQDPRYGHTATLLPNGWVLVAGGCTASCTAGDVTDTTEAYDVNTGYWFGVSPMTQPRYAATATVLRDGTLLVVGGSNYCCRYYDSAETFSVPRITARPASGPVGSHVMLHGNGFYAFEDVRISWDGRLLAKAKTGPAGGFSAPVTVPASGVGVHTILAVGRTSLARAQTIFTVTGSAP